MTTKLQEEYICNRYDEARQHIQKAEIALLMAEANIDADGLLSNLRRAKIIFNHRAQIHNLADKLLGKAPPCIFLPEQHQKS